jgi:hypothetical protein
MGRTLACGRNRGSLLAGLLLLGSCGRTGTAHAADDAAGAEFFETKIRPVLLERCYTCHSASAKKLRGGLRLDTRDGLRQGGDSGPAVIPTDPDKSLLIKAIRYSDPALQMPPKRRLSSQEVADFETWVKRGAPDPRTQAAGKPADPKGRQWAFTPPQAPPLPEVRRKEWIRDPLDRFILAGLEKKGLQSAAAAGKRTLLRRVSYDLIGLPPTPAEITSFLADESPEAFARVVDRLLASPRYGERWGRHWLDLVRYTDDFAESWRYRDWVVKAFNDDLPYDQFVINQIAGDLLPAGQAGAVNDDGIIATTMLSLGPWGGIDRKKRLADIVDDQIDTVGRGFLGLTLACTRCHDHKFDPLTSADYYGLAGIFYSSRVISDTVYLSHGTNRLQIPLVGPAEVDKRRRHMERVHELEKKLEDAVEKLYAAFARSLLPHTVQYLLASWEYQNRPAEQANVSTEEWAKKRGLRPFALAAWNDYLGGSRLGEFALLNRPVRDYDGEPGVHVWGASAERPWWGVNSTAGEVPVETWLLPPRSFSMNPGVEGGAVAWKSPITGRVCITGRLTDADPHDGNGVSWAIDRAGSGGRYELSSGTLPNGGAKTLDQGRHPERLASVAVKPGDVIYLQIWLREGDAHYDITNVEWTIKRLDGPGEWDLMRDVGGNLLAGNPHTDSGGNAGVWAFYNMAGSNRKQRMPAADAALAAWHKAVEQTAAGKLDRAGLEKAAREFQHAAVKGGPDNPLANDLTGIRSPFWVHGRDDAQYLSAKARAELDKLAAEVEGLKNSAPPLPCAHGAKEGGVRFSLFPGFGDARIHVRGSYSRLGARVPRQMPRALAGDAQPKITAGSGRLELARWIASAQNPLTARVMVNRLWQHHFGEGIVRTPSNFGALGSPPTHPELLDYLAREFIASGWSVKGMHRRILLSAAYRQACTVRPDTLRIDPDNLLFSSMNRRRLEAEPLRDSILSVCGCLDLRPGGPADADAQSTRRMVYLRCSRSDRSGFGAVFDAADASIQVDKRTVSTVAPQALLLMNSPLVAEKVGLLVGRPEVAGHDKSDERIAALYLLLFGRPATADEVSIGRRFVESLKDQPAAKKSDGPAGLGPWEAYAQALLLSNEFLFVD